MIPERYTFRGKKIDGSEWVYGDLLTYRVLYVIFDKNRKQHECDGLSIGQCTGLRDKNGVLIFEGDILRDPPKDKYDENNYVSYEVFFHDNDCCEQHIGFQMNRHHFNGAICGTSGFRGFKPEWTKRMIIIGNRYDNPELIKTRAESEWIIR